MSRSFATEAPSARTIDCAHCGTPFAPEGPEDRFCGPACAAVHHRLKDAGLERFYTLRRGPVPPVAPTALAPAPADPDLGQRIATAEAEAAPGGLARTRLGLRGLACTGCVWVVGALAGRREGIARAVADPAAGALDLVWQPGKADPQAFLTDLHRFGYTATPHPGEGAPDGGGDLSTRLGIAAFLAMNGMLFSFPIYFGMPPDQPPAPLFRLLAAGFATGAIVVAMTFFGKRALMALRAGRVAFDLPIALGLLLAYAGSLVGWAIGFERLMYFDFVGTFTFLMLVGRWIHDRAVDRHRRALGLAAGPPHLEIASAAESAADTHRAARGSDLTAGMTYRLPAGATVPVASRPVDGSNPLTVSLAGLNGEPEAHLWPAHRDLPAGAVLLGREPVPLIALESWQESVYRRLLEDPGEPAPSHLQERVLRIWLAVVLIASTGVGLVWWQYIGDPARGLQAMISLLVLSCPCAIGLAWPFADALAAARLRARGVYLRAGDIWGRLRRVRAVAFDKTGTLTGEVPGLLNPESLAALDAEATAALRRIVSDSLHPIGRSLREALAGRGPGLQTDGAVSDHPGLGSELLAHGRCWRLGRHSWVTGTPHPATAPDDTASQAALAVDGRVVATFRFGETPRREAAACIAAMKAAGRPVFLLSGDRPERVAAVAGSLGLSASQAMGALSPEAKAAWIREQAPGPVLFLGDGANDAPAAGVAAVAGTPVADRGALTGRADFLLLHPGLGPVSALFTVGTQRRLGLGAALIFAGLYNISAGLIAASGLMSPLLAAVLMPASSLISLALVATPGRR